MNIAEVKRLVLEFEHIDNRHQNEQWLSALEQLISLGAEPFLKLLSETGRGKEERPVRWVIALVLGRVGNAVAVKPLCRLLDDFPSVQSTAAHALGQIGHPGAVDALIEIISTREDPKVIREAAWALAEIGDARALVPLRTVLLEMTNRNWGGVATPQFVGNSLRRIELRHNAV